MPLIEIDEKILSELITLINTSYKGKTSLWNLSAFCVPHNWHFLVFLATFEIEIVNRKWKIFFWCSISLNIINKSEFLACTIHQTLILLGIKPSNRDYSKTFRWIFFLLSPFKPAWHAISKMVQHSYSTMKLDLHFVFEHSEVIKTRISFLGMLYNW